MTRNEAIKKYVIPAIERTWNEKNCKKILEALERESCEDAISREDALMALTGEWTESRAEILPKAIKRIQKLPSVIPKSDWIPVSEKLPEKYKYTLWCASSGHVTSDYFNGEFWEDAKKYGYEIVAWKPLPAPYKAESEE